MSHPIGMNVRAVCQALESSPQTAMEMGQALSGWGYEKANEYLRRSVRYGFATRAWSAERIMRNFAYVYTVKPDWRELVDKLGARRIEAQKVIARAPRKVAPKPIALKPRQVIPPYVPPVPMFRNSIFDVREFA